MNFQFGSGIKIGQGTHGSIYVDPSNPHMVIKSYHKMNARHCEQMVNEYDYQALLYEHQQHIRSNIYIPRCCCFQENNQMCSYKMERIYPFPGDNYFYIVNMAEPNLHSKFSHSTNGLQVGYSVLSEKGINIKDLAKEIGILFSYMNFILNIDGYDCELIYGSDHSSQPKCFLIDYDKVQPLEWKQGYTAYRKLDENTIEQKVLNTPKRFAMYLFVAFISMSLLPSDAEHKKTFIEGYKTYMPVHMPFVEEVLEELFNYIEEYSV